MDATNYVMLELGHPLHAFDLDMLSEQRIVVRRARAGEKMRTLDGIERTLTAEMCVIADATRAVAIGGVMGGAETEIAPATRNILLECGVVRSDFHSPHVESARAAHRSLARVSSAAPIRRWRSSLRGAARS